MTNGQAAHAEDRMTAETIDMPPTEDLFIYGCVLIDDAIATRPVPGDTPG